MSTATIELRDWLECLKDIATDYAARHLRFQGGVDLDATASSGTRPAVYVAILGEKNSMHLGLATSPGGCRALVRALLGMPARTELTEREVADGMNEILNIVAGKVKSRMSTRDGSLKLGLPMFVTGSVGHGEGIERAAADVSMGPVPCQLLVFRQKRTA